ncbi:threonine/serine exporter family protein [Pediococcus argentinicus]|uniref:threonine/serine exporter family protein n=1 Tax=Pediococcus argentinicus TaxID=480391 RepID=UPI00338ED8A0
MANVNKVIDTCLLAGKIMIENGSEMARAEDTMKRIAQNSGVSNLKIFATVTGLIVSIPETPSAQIENIDRRAIDLEKVSAVNTYSRQYAEQKIDLIQFYEKLTTLDDATPFFPFWLQTLGAAIVSGPLMAVFSGNMKDLLITMLIGGLGFSIFYFINRILNIKFISEFIASLVIGFVAVFAVRAGLGHSIDDIIIGSVMPLVPGVPLTNAVRDVLKGHLVSGPARGVEAILSACAIGFGIAFVFRFV